MTTKTDPIALVRIVDDDPELLKSAAFLIRMAGYDVLTYESAASFLALDDGLRPGCIILDQRMPGMTGLELQEALLEKGSTTPIIFLSAHGDIPMAMQAVHRGAMDFLVKPADPEVLVAAVKKAVEKSNKDETFRYHIAKVVEEDDSLQEEPVLTDADLVLGIRPEFLDIADSSALEGEIYGAMPTGMESTIKVRVGDFLLTGVIFGSSLFTIGAKVPLSISGDNIMLFDRKSGRCIAFGSLSF